MLTNTLECQPTPIRENIKRHKRMSARGTHRKEGVTKFELFGDPENMRPQELGRGNFASPQVDAEVQDWEQRRLDLFLQPGDECLSVRPGMQPFKG